MKNFYSFIKTTSSSFIAFIVFAISIHTANAQLLWGYTTNGGVNGFGSIFNMETDSTTITHYDLQGIGASGPQYSDMVLGSNGLLYGMARAGGSFNKGVIFTCDTGLHNFTIVYSFNTSTGMTPYASLLLASNGEFYGMTEAGGKNGLGVIFSFNPNTLTYTDVFDFVKATGGNPYGSLIQLANGKLYGCATSGGSSGTYGTIFSFDPVKLAYTDIFNFNGTTNGGIPDGTLVQASNGKLYGTAQTGGSNTYYGVVFSLDTGTHAYTVVYNFDNTTGRAPISGLMKSASGKLYGTADGGKNVVGVIYSVDPTTNTYADIYDFTDLPDVGGSGELIQLPNGKLYGIVGSGGANNNGIIYSFDTGTATVTVLRNLKSTDGSQCNAELLYGPKGRLYALNGGGGTARSGTLMECDTAGNLLNLVNLNTYTTGSEPSGTPLYASNGLFYGIANWGGLYGYGLIFTFNPVTHAFADVHDFNDTLGGMGYNISGLYLMQAQNGLIYGLTSAGGANNNGAIFSYDPIAGTYKDIHDFNSATGSFPELEALLQASNGFLYGNTLDGGTNTDGVLFSIDPSTYTYTDLYNFGSAEGNPSGTLIQATNNKIYGPASGWNGNINYYYGFIYSYSINSNTFTDISNFSGGLTGVAPYGGLCQATTGKLYGITDMGGTNGWSNGYEGDGAIYTLDTLGKAFADIHNCSDTTGGGGVSSFIQANDGKLYAMMPGGLQYELGLVFQWDTVAKLLTVKHFFTGTDGASPAGSFAQTKPIKNLMTSTINVTQTCSHGQILTAVVNQTPTSTYTYLWNTGATTSSISNITAVGTYSLTIKDAYGDSIKTGIALSGYSLPNSSQSFTVCHGQSVTVGIHTYTASGSYIDTLKSIGGCDSIVTTNLTVNSLPVPIFSGKDTICTGGTTTLSVSGGTTYLWSNGLGTASIKVSPTTTTTYSVSVTSASGCIKDTAITLIVGQMPVITVSGKDTICTGDSTMFTASGANTYTWYPNINISATTGVTVTVNTATDRNYFATGISSLGCSSSRVYEDVMVEPTLTLTASANPASIIMGDSTIITANGATKYVWSPASSLNKAIGTSVIAAPTATTTYTVVGSNGGCTDTLEVIVIVQINTGINNVATGSNIILYPDPANATLNILFNGEGKPDVQFKVVDITGKEVISRNIIVDNSKPTLIDISTLAQGMYFVEITTDKNRQVAKFIKL